MSKRTCYSILFLAALGLTLSVAHAQAPLPAAWPKQMELGMADAPGGAAAMKSTAPFKFRYQYLAGGANTGSGWATWNANGDFAKFYIQDSMANGIIPVFTYYMMLQSTPSTGASEGQRDSSNLQNTSTMTAYYNDLKLLFQKAGAFPTQPVVLHVEPDLWGYVEQLNTNNDASTVAAKVSETGLAELAGLPSNVSGFARAIVKLRDTYAPNVMVAYHISVWGTGTDIALSNPPDATVDALGAKAAAFYNSLGANFDLTFAEFSDRDSGFYQYVYGNPNAWWDSEDFRRNVRFLGDFSSATNKRIVMWQIPLGNTKMRAQNNTTGHYQDNRPEWLLDEPARTHLAAYRDAGVVAFLFGGGAGGTSCACDGQSDGVTNPAAVNGNAYVSAAGTGAPSFNGTTLTTPYAANDDGGFFRWKAWQYYQTGAIPLTSAPGAPTNLRIVP
jgi:hypothetical protein